MPGERNKHFTEHIDEELKRKEQQKMWSTKKNKTFFFCQSNHSVMQPPSSQEIKFVRYNF